MNRKVGRILTTSKLKTGLIVGLPILLILSAILLIVNYPYTCSQYRSELAKLDRQRSDAASNGSYELSKHYQDRYQKLHRKGSKLKVCN